MKMLFTILLVLFLAGCASTEWSKGMDPEIKYGGTFQTRVISSHGI